MEIHYYEHSICANACTFPVCCQNNTPGMTYLHSPLAINFLFTNHQRIINPLNLGVKFGGEKGIINLR